jgi:prepilin-type N-terminal cleavage/methylation domain-containing protein
MIGVKTDTRLRKGFTLMEALIVMATFGILVTLIADIFVRTTGFGHQVVMRAKLQGDARNALEAISRAIRVSDVDYGSWGGTLPAQPPPNTELRLINPISGLTSRIKREITNTGCYSDGASYPCIVVSTDNGGTWTPLSPKGAKIDALLFYVSPNKDPFLYDGDLGTYASDKQPVITVVMTVHGLAGRPQDEWIYTLQTSMTPRLYLR